ncbi:MAG: VOC family protein [Dehalococcoidia bacterium]
MGRIVHFEIPADDVGRAKQFYGNVLGWRFETWDGPEAYLMAMTGENEPGIDGAIVPRSDGFQSIVNTADVASLDEAVERVRANGGTVVEARMPIPGVGYLAYCIDTEGNSFGLMQSDPAAA